MKVLELTTSVTIVSLLLTLFFSAPAFCAVSPEAYVNRTHGFSINPPSGWVMNDTGVSPPLVVTFYGPVIAETGGKININIAVETTSLTLNQYVVASKSQYASVFLNFNLVSEGSRNIGGLNGYELVITWTYMPGANVSNTHAFNVKQKQVLFVEKGKAYAITFTASPTNYDEYLPVFEESLQTFKLLGQEPPWLFIGMLVGVVIVVGVVCCAAILYVIKKSRMKTQQQKIEREMLDVLRLQKSMKIEDLAKTLETNEVGVELTVIRLRKNGVPISFNREKREVIYEKQE